MTTLARDENRLLAEIGVSEQEEQAYRLLLAHGTLAVHQLGEALHLPTTESAQLLESLISKGLAACEPGVTGRFAPRNPEVAIEALILRQQARLERARAAIMLLKQAGEPGSGAPGSAVSDLVEVVSGRESVQRAYATLQSTARHDLRCLVPAASLIAELGSNWTRAATQGVRRRTVFDAVAMWDCVSLEQLRGPAASRDEYRFAASVPCGLMLADRRLALLVLEHDGPHCAVLLVKACATLDGLAAIFDLVWSQATPLEAVTAPRDTPAAFSAELEELLPLLAAGWNDKAIAHRLRISSRTLIRRVAKLLTTLDARSRFQAGWAAALRLHGITATGSMPAEHGRPAAGHNEVQRDAAENGSTYHAVTNAPGVRLR